MSNYTVYRLDFKTQLHLGRATGPAQEGSLGLEKTETYIPCRHTLFSNLPDVDYLLRHRESYRFSQSLHWGQRRTPIYANLCVSFRA